MISPIDSKSHQVISYTDSKSYQVINRIDSLPSHQSH